MIRKIGGTQNIKKTAYYLATYDEDTLKSELRLKIKEILGLPHDTKSN